MRRPKLLTGDGAPQERHASWLELFFDLVFVVAIAQLGELLIHDQSATGILHFTILFAAIFWAWVQYTFYADRFETDDVAFRLMTGAMMLAVIVAGVQLSSAFENDGTGFALSMVAVQVAIVLLYCWAYALVPQTRELTARYATGFGLAGLIWLVSVPVDTPVNQYLWVAAILVGIGTPLVSIGVIDRTPVHTLHIPERFGLFTIIVLGEAVVSVATGTELTDSGLEGAFVGAIGFLCAGTLWWIYFDFVDGEATITRRSLARLLYVNAHLPLLAGLTAFGIGVKLAIIDADLSATASSALWLMCVGAAMFLLAQALMHLTDIESFDDLAVRSRALAATALIVLALLGSGLAPIVFISLLLAILVCDLLAEIVDEARHSAHAHE